MPPTPAPLSECDAPFVRTRDKPPPWAGSVSQLATRPEILRKWVGLWLRSVNGTKCSLLATCVASAPGFRAGKLRFIVAPSPFCAANDPSLRIVVRRLPSDCVAHWRPHTGPLPKGDCSQKTKAFSDALNSCFRRECGQKPWLRIVQR